MWQHDSDWIQIVGRSLKPAATIAQRGRNLQVALNAISQDVITEPMPVREKAHRLPEECYTGFVSVAFTVCTSERLAFLQDAEIARTFEQILSGEAARFECGVLFYVFMPDHCHILLQGKSEKAHLLKAMTSFKQKSGYWLSRHRPGMTWQKDFYDHILRSEEEISRQLRYMLENPVRKNLVEDWKKYEFKGSTLHDFEEWLF